MTCGAGYELLLCGASGTSKAMTVSTVAHDLKKRVLLVGFPSLQWENIFLQYDGGTVTSQVDIVTGCALQ
ncbi:hypothetical protein PI124_g576 [Phytophthora idaei]|nr:hypothetical protein PI124_g576 [Phytophthora idaei]